MMHMLNENDRKNRKDGGAAEKMEEGHIDAGEAGNREEKLTFLSGM